MEAKLQWLIEGNMETMLGIRFLATEFRTERHGSRIDSLGLDENGTPDIVEFKRTRDEAVLVQGLSVPVLAAGPPPRVRELGAVQARRG
ncbi:hypothetical protein ABZV77_12655 [Streptomyces sp. NPDC004732]|uniref:hypothetical protein n=1 Tax=Streptomyces sp. NPDC004732 TaxID=3154290 RepID=UPI0033AD7E06